MGPYGVLTIPLIGIVIFNNAAYCEMSVYPGLRRKPAQPSALQQQFDISPDLLAQLMEDNARRRLQQQFEQQLELINMQMSHHREKQQQQQQQHQHQHGGYNHHEQSEHSDEIANDRNEGPMIGENPKVDFTYKFAETFGGNEDTNTIPFAVDPSDPRYYLENQPEFESYEEYVPLDMKPVTGGAEVAKTIDTTATFHRIKPQSSSAGINVAPMKPVQNVVASGVRGGNAINALIEKLQKDGNSGAILNSQETGRSTDEHVVMRQHLGIEGEMGMYVVALIAGVSAAVTVGLIALGVAWYTLSNKAKAAADVEYPAYGVTGPNKDISPSGDRRLAQSAQMYHYQHQKQQIIAMENRQVIEGQCGLSDVESDDDNEEGDYTVYECPGLAPTGEMEVKNPLFLDETPVTPSGNTAVAAAAAAVSTQAVSKSTKSPQRQPHSVRKPPAKANRSSEENRKPRSKK